MGKRGMFRTLEGGLLSFYCPGCKTYHAIDDRWTVSGPDEAPTVRASVLTRYTIPPSGDSDTWTWKEHPGGKADGARDMVCHLFITDGQIQFLSDCTHELAGKTVPMEEDPYE